MAATANRQVAINVSGDSIINKIYEAAENAASPGSITVHSLSTGNNTITVPSSTGITVKGATIVPPSDNTQAITLKGVGGDTGIVISSTDPTSIGFQAAPASFVLNVGGNIAGLRIVWT